MAWLTLPQRPPPRTGLGFAEVIAGILGPIIEGGAGAYGIYTQSKQHEVELEQRKKEFDESQQLAREQLEAQAKSLFLAQQAAIQKTQARSMWIERNAPYLLGAAGIGALALVTIVFLKRK